MERVIHGDNLNHPWIAVNLVAILNEVRCRCKVVFQGRGVDSPTQKTFPGL